MRYHLDSEIEKEIVQLAKEHDLQKVLLFGSRARGTNHERSDIDLAASGKDVVGFSFDVDEKVRTLLMFDVVNLNRRISEELKAEIARDGVVIYEKV